MVDCGGSKTARGILDDECMGSPIEIPGFRCTEQD
jgi:hypothetical protein